MAQAPPNVWADRSENTSHSVQSKDETKKKVTASDKETSEPRTQITAITEHCYTPTFLRFLLLHLEHILSLIPISGSYPDLGRGPGSKDRERRKPRRRRLLGACRSSSNRPRQRLQDGRQTTLSSLKPQKIESSVNNHLVAIASWQCPPSSLCAQSGPHRYVSAPPSSHYFVGWPVPGLLAETSQTTSSHLKNSQRPSKRLLPRPSRRNPE